MSNFSILALGGNLESRLGDPVLTLRQALEALKGEEIQLVKASHFFRTPAFPAGSGPDYVNSAALVQANHSPVELLEALHRIEAELGRVRTTRWGSRPVDIDLIAHGQDIAPSRAVFDQWQGLSLEDQQQKWPQELILPHPRLQDRAFVLVPMAEVAPDWVHPVFGKTTLEMLNALPENLRREVVRL